MKIYRNHIIRLFKILNFRVLVIVALMFFCACPCCLHAQNAREGSVKSTIQKFELPSIPNTKTKPEERLKYLVAHYWDNFDFKDTTLIHHPEITEQAFSNYIDLLARVSADSAKISSSRVLNHAVSDSIMFSYFADLFNKYLYDLNSHCRNEELYIPVLQHIVAMDNISDLQKLQSEDLLRRLLKNRVGHTASDFVYTLPNGKSSKLSGIKAIYTIIFFNNPDCDDCKMVKNEMDSNALFSAAVHKKNGALTELAVLAVYPYGDIPAWKTTVYPRWMINGFDAGQQILNNQIYDLRAMPTLYLLDKEKRVVLKDAALNDIVEYLKRNNIL